jgi:hypothetical protein
MYWYKEIKKQRSSITPLSRGELGRSAMALLLVTFVCFFSSCKPDNIQSGTNLKYFDLKGYFTADTARLRKLDPAITKTVTHNGVTETKKVHIKNWGSELSLFIQSDINKPAWRDSYTVQKSGGIEIYRTKDPALKTREVMVKKDGDKVKWIAIFNSSKNILYQTREKLSYFPDSLYIIQKYQKVRLLGANTYTIKGSFN